MRLPRIFRTASFRLAALYVLLFSASVLVLGAVVFWTARNALEQQIRARIETEATFLTGEFRSGGLPGLLAAVRRREHGVGALDYLVQAPDGTRLGGDLPATASASGWVTLDVGDKADEQSGAEQAKAFVVRLPDGGLLAVGDDMDRLNDVQEAIVTALLWVVGFTVLLGIGGGLLLSRGFLHRVDTISRTAEAIIGGDLTRRIPLRGTRDDLDRLAQTLNHMLDRNSDLMDSLRQVSTDIAHDLRTPLSRLLQRLDMARSGTASLDDYAGAIDAAAAEAEEILATFAALLRIAQIEAASGQSEMQDVNLSQVAETVVEAFAPSAEEQDHRLEGHVEPEIHIRGDRELLTQLLVNLIENALRHTPSGTRIVVSLAHRAGQGVQLSVADDGPGIQEAERSLVLRRFYRCEHSRTTPGNGLGLSLVAAIARMHGAELLLEDAAPGLCVTIAFKPGALRHPAA